LCGGTSTNLTKFLLVHGYAKRTSWRALFVGYIASSRYGHRPASRHVGGIRMVVVLAPLGNDNFPAASLALICLSFFLPGHWVKRSNSESVGSTNSQARERAHYLPPSPTAYTFPMCWMNVVVLVIAKLSEFWQPALHSSPSSLVGPNFDRHFILPLEKNTYVVVCPCVIETNGRSVILLLF
jgi:hypothetical protein